MKTATITKIELVNGSMLTFNFKFSEGASLNDFDMASVIEGYLNEGGGAVNSYLTETELKPGDVITEDGEIIEGNGDAAIEETYLETKKSSDYRDAFENKGKY